MHTCAGEQEAAAAAEQRLSLARLSELMNEPASSSELRLLGSLLTPSALAQLVHGHANSAGSLEPLATQLDPTQRQQLAPEPPPPSAAAEMATQADPPSASAPEDARHALARMDESQLLTLLDDIARCFFNGDERSSKCLRRCIVVKQRIKAYCYRESKRPHPDFLQTILETYGADGEERLPFGSFLSHLLYYATRIADDTHWEKTVSGFKFNDDGGFYMEAWIDFMTDAGHSAVNFLRGPLFSNMVKLGRMKRGVFKLSELSLKERGERPMLGAAVPSVRAINKRIKPEDKIDRGGVSAPLLWRASRRCGSPSRRSSAR